jgi:hypothetical protein
VWLRLNANHKMLAATFQHFFQIKFSYMDQKWENNNRFYILLQQNIFIDFFFRAAIMVKDILK